MLGNGVQYGVEAYAATKRRCNFGDHLLRNVHVDIVTHQARLQRELDDGTFEATHVACDAFGEVVQHFVADFQVAFFCLLVKNGFASFNVRRLDVYGKAPGKAADEAVGEVLDFGGGRIGSEHDLLSSLMQRVEVL